MVLWWLLQGPGSRMTTQVYDTLHFLVVAAAPPTGDAAEDAAGGVLGGISPNAQQTLANLLLAFGIVVFAIVMLRVLRNRRGKISELDRDPTERIEELREQAEHRRDHVDRAMSDAEDLSRRMSSTLDTQATRLELLIEDAERVARRLEEALATARTDSPTANTARPTTPRVSNETLGRARLEQLQRERSEREPTPPASNGTGPKTTGMGGFRGDVARLADRGLSAQEIARELGHPQGEVELVLNLRRSG